MAKNASISRLAYNDRLSQKKKKKIKKVNVLLLDTFLNYCLPDYEKNCLTEYVNSDPD